MIKKYILKDEHIGKRFDIAISDVVGDEFSRSEIQNFIKNEKIYINGEILKSASKKVLDKFCIEIFLDDTRDIESFPDPQNIPIDIVYEDEYLIVIDKPYGMVCHPSIGHIDNTLVNAIMWHTKDKGLSDIGGMSRPGIVHRLDMDTSGLIIIAKNNEIHRKLSDMFQNYKGERIIRKYLCYTFNTPDPKSGTIDTFIIRHPKLRQQYCVSNTNGKQAITIYKTIKNKYITSTKSISLIECELLTGRTHQIRVHMKHIGCPIIGDKVYSKKKIEHTYPDIIKNFHRQALHSYYIMFIHPITSKTIELFSEIPNDMKNIDMIF